MKEGLALLRLRPRAGVRFLVKSNLRRADRALRTLEAAGDPDALHQFRVTVRRARSLLKSYAPLLDETLSKKSIERLGELLEITGASRDAQVQRAWLAESPAGMEASEEQARKWLRRELKTEQGKIKVRALRKAYWRTRERVVAELRGEPIPRRSAAPLTFGQAAAQGLRSSGAELLLRMSRLRRVQQAFEAHRLRIAGKRVRYLLEELPEVGELRTQVERLKRLQTLLGRLHDLQVLEGRVRKLRKSRAVRRKSERRDGMKAIATRLQQEERELFTTIQEEFLGRRISEEAQALDRLAHRIAANGPRGQ